MGFGALVRAGIMISADVEKGLVTRCIRCDSDQTRKDGHSQTMMAFIHLRNVFA